jgi:hypothetical protein
MRLLYVCFILSLAALAQSIPPSETQPIAQTAFTIPAKSSKEFSFKVPPGVKQARLVGHFKASGGLHNEIIVFVMNDDQFVNWRNDPIRNNPVKDNFKGAMYDSHKVTQGTIKLFLPLDPAVYHVVFYNGYSVMTPKAAETTLALEITR